MAKLGLTILLALALLTATSAADLTEPVLLTTIGQAADLTTAKLILKKAGVDTTKFVVDKLAGADKVPKAGTLALVVGASNKGLGEARISIDSEIARAETLMVAAKKMKTKILLIHIGGKERRGPQSDGINRAVAAKADYFLVRKDGDEDKLFKTFATQGKKPYVSIKKIGEGIPAMRTAFGK